jgi:hypothetical protein
MSFFKESQLTGSVQKAVQPYYSGLLSGNLLPARLTFSSKLMGLKISVNG